MLDTLLALRLREVEAVTLPRLVAGDPQLRRASAKLAEAMFRSRDRIGEELAAEASRQAFASRMVKGMFQYLTRGYQYIDVAEVQLPELAAIYISFVDGLAQLSSIQERTNWSHALETILQT